MGNKVLVTGGAGFIGTHLTRRLLKEGVEVTLLDIFSPQVHGGNESLAPDIADHVNLVKGDVRDRSVLLRALAGQDSVVHLAAETGTGQSMYEVCKYESVNMGGTALLMELLVGGHAPSISRVVVASSRAVYGEGAYECPEHGEVAPGMRDPGAMKAGNFEVQCPRCGQVCSPLPTPEAHPLAPCSFYGLTKQVQERTCLLFGEALRMPVFALRYQNVFGPGQSLKNPYTGILAVFSGQARVGGPIQVFEDGLESRDFVFIEDVVEATWRCLATERTGQRVYNVGSGSRTNVLEVASTIIELLGSSSALDVTGAFRVGDIRHNYASLDRLKEDLGVTPRWSFREGLQQFLQWALAETFDMRGYERSLEELRSKKLMG